jgi:hypothetical protein
MRTRVHQQGGSSTPVAPAAMTQWFDAPQIGQRVVSSTTNSLRDMAVGALCDLGVDSGKLEAELRKLSFGETRFQFERQSRRGISGTKFCVCEDEDGQTHLHGRSYEQIRDLISRSALSMFVRRRSLAIFERIAMAEAKIHGVPLETVGFHEVGAVDSIADIVGTCVALRNCRRIVSLLRDAPPPAESSRSVNECVNRSRPPAQRSRGVGGIIWA